MKLRTLVGVAAAGMLSASAVQAGPFYIEAGSYGFTEAPMDADTRTTDLDSLGWTDTLATSIYFGLTPGSTVIDTNDAGILNTYGIPLPTDPQQRLISDLNPWSGNLGDPEGFTDSSALWGIDFLGGTYWGMTYTYTLQGQINAAGTGVDFTSGYFDIFFEDGTITDQLLRLELNSFSLTDGGATYTVLAFGNVTFDWGPPSAFAQNFFVDSESGLSFYDLWFNGGNINPIAISWRMDNNIDCPPGEPNCTGVPLPGQLEPIFVDGELIGGWRQTTVDGTVRFEVPEPGTLALMGLGLLGLGAVRRFASKRAA